MSFRQRAAGSSLPPLPVIASSFRRNSTGGTCSVTTLWIDGHVMKERPVFISKSLSIGTPFVPGSSPTALTSKASCLVVRPSFRGPFT